MKKLCWFNLYFLLMTILSFENGFAQDYETPPVLKSANLLPPELVKSEVHRIHDDVTTDGCFYHFTMESCFGMYDVESMDLLKIRIHEVQTLANVIEKNQSDEFFQGLGKRMHQTISTPVKMIQDPVGAISALGQGIEKKFQRIGNRFKSKETRPQEDSGIRANLIDKEKRELAAELNLDVYSTNPKVQEFLTQVAEARARRAVALKIATFALPGNAGLAVSALSFCGQTEDLLRDNSPADLYVYNEKKLKDMDFSRNQIDPFLKQPDLSPRHQTIIVAALESLGGVSGREFLLEAASKTKGKESLALFQENRAVHLSYYHTHESRLKKIEMHQDLPIAVTESGKNVLLLPFDIVYGSEEWITKLNGLVKSKDDWELIITGQMTSQAKNAAESAGFHVFENYRIDKK